MTRTFGLDSGYPLVPLISYTPYVAVVAVVVVMTCALLRRWAATAVAAVAAVALAVALAPRVVGSEYANSEGIGVRVMTANLYRGEGDPKQLLRLVREHHVDILALQELTPDFVESFERAGVGSELKFDALAPREGVSGSGLYSRLELDRGGSGPRTFLQMSAGVRFPVPLGVVSVHPVPPTSRDATREWESALDEFSPASDDEDFGTVQLLLGDFNATFDQEAFRELLDRGYVDAGERTGQGLTPTWPSLGKSLRYLPVTIDHLLVEGDKVLGVRDYEVLDLEGSDHRPVVAEFVLRPP